MRSLAGLLFLIAVSGWSARAQDEAEWIYSVRLTVNASTEEELVRARNMRLEETLRPLVAPRIVWQYAEREPGAEGRLVARLFVVVSTRARADRPGYELMGQTRPGLALALHSIHFVVTDTSGATKVPTRPAKDQLLERERERVEKLAEQELSRLIARAGTAGTAWTRSAVRQETEVGQDTRGEPDPTWIWVTTRARTEVVFLGPDVLGPDVPPRRNARTVEGPVKLAPVGAGGACTTPPASPSRGLADALDLTPAKRGGKKKKEVSGGH